MAIFGVSLTSTIESLAYSKKRCKRSIQSDIDGIAAMNLVTTWAVSRIEDISKELIRQSEHGTIKGVGKSSMGEQKSSRIILGKEVDASGRSTWIIPSNQDNRLRITEFVRVADT